VADFLTAAIAATRDRVRTTETARPLAEVKAAARARPAPPSFASALSGPGVAIIAEVKRASPSRGEIADIPDAAALARAYVEGGAAAVSVLTEPRWFHGSLDDLAAVAAAVTVPVLRKDVVVDPYQIWEARAAGAAAVLLIVAALDDATLAALRAEAAAAGLDALVEVHDEAEASRLPAGEPLIVGVNARSLSTLEVDPDRFAAVRGSLPPGALAVAESGIRGPADIRRHAALGADAVLVGEHAAAALAEPDLERTAGGRAVI
jgi:indole-3-glycerol phosphate synthase